MKNAYEQHTKSPTSILESDICDFVVKVLGQCCHEIRDMTKNLNTTLDKLDKKDEEARKFYERKKTLYPTKSIF